MLRLGIENDGSGCKHTGFEMVLTFLDVLRFKGMSRWSLEKDSWGSRQAQALPPSPQGSPGIAHDVYSLLGSVSDFVVHP